MNGVARGRLLARTDQAADALILALLWLRPLVWSGDPASLGNTTYLSLLAASILVGALRRSLAEVPPLGRLGWCGVAALALLVAAAVRSPDPANAWTLVSGWLLHLGAAWALAWRLRERPTLVVAGMLAGLVGEALLLLVQVGWERPTLQARLANPDAVDPRQCEQFVVRAHSWRLEGSFLLANTLAAWLLLAWPLAIGLGRRWWPFVLMASGALLATGSKMAGLAWLAALLIAALVQLRGQRRWWSGSAVVLAALILVAWPAFRERATASAEARFGYWQGAVQLVGERPLLGHGLDGFRVAYPRVKPPAAEETIYVHQEPLQAAVDLGIPSALLVCGWLSALAVVAWRRRRALELAPLERSTWLVAAGLVAWLLLVGHVIDGELLPPGGPWLVGALLVIAPGLVWVTLRTVTLPAWCLPTAITACLLHALADFHLHSPQVIGPLACLAMLIGPAAATAAVRARPQWRWLMAGGAVFVVTLTGTSASQQRQTITDAAHETLATLGDTQSQMAPLISGLAASTVHDQVVAALRWPADAAQAVDALAVAHQLITADATLAATMAELGDSCVEQFPQHPAVISAACDLHRRAGHRDQALTLARRACSLYPVHLPFLVRCARLEREAGNIAEALCFEVKIHRLEPLVHSANRP